MYEIYKIYEKNGKEVGNETNVCQASKFEKLKRLFESHGLKAISIKEQKGEKK